MKRCIKCKEEKPFEDFSKHKTAKDGRQSSCKECAKEYKKQWCENNKEKEREYKKQYYENNKEYFKEYAKEYYENNKEFFKEYFKEYYERNKEKVKEYSKQYRKENKEYFKEYYERNKEKVKEYSKQYRKENKEKILEQSRQYYENNKEFFKEYFKEYYENNKEKFREWNKQYYENNKEKVKEYSKQYQNQRRKNDPEFRLRASIRVAFHRFLNGNKEEPTYEYLKQCGYTKEELMKHLEDQFDQNMTWDNYGSYWHVDHIIPQSVFEPTNEQHLKWCWSLENLRPLEASENRSKSANIIPEEVEKISFYEDVKHLLKD